MRFSYVYVLEVGINLYVLYFICWKIGFIILNFLYGGGLIFRFEGLVVDILYFFVFYSNGLNKEYIGMVVGIYLYCII